MNIYEEKKRLECELQSLKKKVAEVNQKLASVTKEVKEWESLAPQGMVKCCVQYFTFPFHPYGGGNPDKRKFIESRVIYLTPEEYMSHKGEHIEWGKITVISKC